jgi:hypothetical protein
MEAEVEMKKYFNSQVMCPLLWTCGKETLTINRQFVERAIYKFLGKSVGYKMG